MPLRIRRKPEWLQAILIGASTLIGAGTFWYTDIHAPAVSPATLTMTPTLEAIGRQGDDLLVRASLKIENRSNYRVYVPAFWYTVRGYCFRPRAVSADSYEAAVRAWSGGGVQSRFNDRADESLLVVGRPSPRKDSYYDPSSERRYEELFLVPRSQFSALRMTVTYMVAKDVSEIDTTRFALADNHDVREEVFIARRATAIDPVSHHLTRVTRTERYDRNRHRAWAERAGAAWGWSHASLSLWPLANDAAAAPPASAATARAPAPPTGCTG